MAGLMAYAAAGAVGGFGEGMVEVAAQRREDAINANKERMRTQERMEDRAWALEDAERERGWEVEDRNYKEAAADRRAARRGSGSGSSGSQYRLMTAEEKAEAGLPENGVYEVNTRTGNIQSVSTGSGGRGGGRSSSIPVSTWNKVYDELSKIGSEYRDHADEIMAEIEANVEAGMSIAEAKREVLGRVEREEVEPDPAGNVVSRGLGTIFGDTWVSTDPDAGHPPDNAEAVKRGGRVTGIMPRGGEPAPEEEAPAPAGGDELPRPQSPEEYEKLPKGTRFIDPAGKVRIKP